MSYLKQTASGERRNPLGFSSWTLRFLSAGSAHTTVWLFGIAETMLGKPGFRTHLLMAIKSRFRLFVTGNQRPKSENE
jgi:hypothetical protein